MRILGGFLLGAALVCLSLSAEPPAPASAAAKLTLPTARSPLSPEALLDPGAGAWQRIPVRTVGLNRTPPLYDTDPPSEPEIPLLEVRVARAGGELVVHLSWRDASPDRAELASAPDSPPEERVHKELTAATERFFDAAAVMFPAEAAGGALTPSLQMGDRERPVIIYYWNAARGALLLEAQGRGTTRRTGESFPARGIYRNGRWQVTMTLPELPAGVPLAFAVWNGSQQDRDGRKYFTIWHWLE